MAKLTQKQKRELANLVADLMPAVQAAFLAAVDELHAGVDWDALVAALTKGDIEAAIAALSLDTVALYGLKTALEAAYATAGVVSTTNIVSSSGIRFRFNMKNPSAEAWIANNVGDRITHIVGETVEIVRDLIVGGYAKGEHPFTMALDIAGRVGTKGIREGGVMGLDRPRADRFLTVTTGMRSAAGVRDLVVVGPNGPYVRYKVNKATEQRILAAYAKGTAVPEGLRELSAKQYYNALLKARGETIARTETGQAVMGAKFESWEQALQVAGLTPEDIIKTWRHGSSSKWARDEHIEMNNKSVRGLYTPFEFKNGVKKQHALDGLGGGAHDINCGCGTEFRLDRAKGLL